MKRKLGLIIFLMSLNYVLANEKKGVELGENSLAIGLNSISTSVNGQSIGNGAISTGKEFDKESFKNNFENQLNKKNEIDSLKNELIEKNEEFNKFNMLEKDIINAITRIDSMNNLKEKTLEKYNESKNDYDQKKSEYDEKKRELDEKLKRINTKLNLAGISGINHKDEESLTRGAKELKVRVEDGSDFNLEESFYKNYIKNYYTVLGDTRKNEELMIVETLHKEHFKDKYTGNISEEAFSKKTFNELNGQHDQNEIETRNRGLNESFAFFAYDENNNPYGIRNNTIKKYLNEEFKNVDNLNGANGFISPSYMLRNRYTIKINEDEYNQWERLKDKYLEKQKEIVKKSTNGYAVLGENPNLNEYIDFKAEKGIELLDTYYKEFYYQWKYENTNSTVWLDKKKKILEERKLLGEANTSASPEYASLNLSNQLIEELRKKRDEGIGKEDIDLLKKYNFYRSDDGLLEMYKNIWSVKNITQPIKDLELATERLTTELSNSLNIDKDALNSLKNDLDNKLREVENLKKTYDAIEINPGDLVLSAKEKEVKAKLEEITNEITVKTERIKLLEEEIKNSPLINKGKDNIAMGTEAFVGGNNSIVLGKEGIIIGEDNVAIGTSNIVKGENNTTIGKTNIVYGDNNHVYGNNNKIGLKDVKKNNNFILGSNIDAREVENAIVLGNESKAVSNALSVGTQENPRNIKFVKEAEISNESKDAVNGSQLFALAEASLPEINVTNWKNKLGITEKGDIIVPPNIVTYVNDDHNEISLGKNNIPVLIKNVALPVNAKDAANKEYVDKAMSKSNSGIASAIAHANIPTNNVNKTHTFGAAMGYYDKDWAVSLGYSGVEKNIGFKVTAALNSALKPSIGTGISYTFGDFEVKQDDKNEALISLENKLLNLEKKVNEKFELVDEKVENLSKDVDNLKNHINIYDDLDLKNDLFNLKKQMTEILFKQENLKNSKEILILDDFEFDKFYLSKENIEKLEKFILKFKNIQKITIIGNTDIKGGEDYNLLLSEKRAKEVRDYLVRNLNIDSKKINYYGASSRELVSYKDNLNRRVEIFVR